MMRTVRFTAVGLALLLSGCDVATVTFGDGGAHVVPERWRPWLITDHQVYVAGFTAQTIEFTIRFRFENRGRAAVAIPRCTSLHRPALDKLVAGEWVQVLSHVEQCWTDPVVIGPGRFEHFTYRVQAFRPHTHLEPQFRTTRIPGTYRLRWDLYEYDAFSQFRIGARLPIEHRVSNEFEVVL